MPYINFQKHCLECKKGEPCDNFHVYALELSTDVLLKPQFKDANPSYKPGKPCVYVGYTRHHPRCRLSMHVNCKPGDWQGKLWECVCSMNVGVKQCTLATRGSGVVKDFVTGCLKPSLYRAVNPQATSAESTEVEEQLSRELRSRGFGVWAGHHDGAN